MKSSGLLYKHFINSLSKYGLLTVSWEDSDVVKPAQKLGISLKRMNDRGLTFTVSLNLFLASIILSLKSELNN